jgi:Putative prokaryotic signal transducing protein
VEVALAEAGRRGLALNAPDDAVGDEAALAHGPLKLCARYQNPMDAQVFAARLATEGLAPQVLDANTVYASGALFGSLSLGGVRVMVPESQIDEANRIRAAFDAGEYAIDEDYDVDR